MVDNFVEMSTIFRKFASSKPTILFAMYVRRWMESINPDGDLEKIFENAIIELMFEDPEMVCRPSDKEICVESMRIACDLMRMNQSLKFEMLDKAKIENDAKQTCINSRKYEFIEMVDVANCDEWPHCVESFAKKYRHIPDGECILNDEVEMTITRNVAGGKKEHLSFPDMDYWKQFSVIYEEMMCVVDRLKELVDSWEKREKLSDSELAELTATLEAANYTRINVETWLWKYGMHFLDAHRFYSIKVGGMRFSSEVFTFPETLTRRLTEIISRERKYSSMLTEIYDESF